MGDHERKIVPRDTPTEELRRIFRECERALQFTGSRRGVRQLYRAMERIETELELRKRLPGLGPCAS